MKSLINRFKRSPRKTLDELIRSNAPITLANLQEIDGIQCQSEIVAAAKELLNDPNHSHDGYIILGPLAARGDVDAQFMVGEYCEFVLKRPEQAAIWYQLAAGQGYAKAQRNYAYMLMKGRGVTCDRKQAFLWYTMAADQGLAEAQFTLGEFFKSGEDVPLDLNKAIYWYDLAKKNGFEQAEIRLMQIRGIIPGKKEDSKDHINVSKAILKLPEDEFRSEHGNNWCAAKTAVSSDFQKAFPLIYIN